MAQADYCDCRDCNFNLEGTGPYQIVSNLSSEGFLELCSFDCRVAFMRKWIQSHLQECKRIGGIRRAPYLYCFELCAHHAVMHPPRVLQRSLFAVEGTGVQPMKTSETAFFSEHKL